MFHVLSFVRHRSGMEENRDHAVLMAVLGCVNAGASFLIGTDLSIQTGT